MYSLEWARWWNCSRATGYRPLFCSLLGAKCITFSRRLWPLSKRAHKSYVLLENSNCVCFLSVGLSAAPWCCNISSKQAKAVLQPSRTVLFQCESEDTSCSGDTSSSEIRLMYCLWQIRLGATCGSNSWHCSSLLQAGMCPRTTAGFYSAYKKIDTLQNSSWGCIKICE